MLAGIHLPVHRRNGVCLSKEGAQVVEVHTDVWHQLEDVPLEAAWLLARYLRVSGVLVLFYLFQGFLNSNDLSPKLLFCALVAWLVFIE